MNDEKWFDIVDMVEEKLEVLDKTRQEVPIGDDIDGAKALEIVETVIFEGLEGKMKIERTTRPAILDRKAIKSKRIGDRERVEYQYSDTEKVQSFKAYKWGGNDWVEIENDNLGF